MLIIKIRKKVILLVVCLLAIAALGGVLYSQDDTQRKPLACQGKVKSTQAENDRLIRKDYDVYFYLSHKNQGLVMISGIYVGTDNVPQTLRRTFSFDAQWNRHYLVVRNIKMDKNSNDTAPDEAIPLLGENEVVKFEILRKGLLLISSVHSKMACNLRD